jgi:hypothetical protein
MLKIQVLQIVPKTLSMHRTRRRLFDGANGSSNRARMQKLLAVKVSVKLCQKSKYMENKEVTRGTTA